MKTECLLRAVVITRGLFMNTFRILTLPLPQIIHGHPKLVNVEIAAKNTQKTFK